jgi:hypothetical protein
MSRLPKPLFKWESEMLKEPIYVLQAYNYRISIERAKEIYENTGIKLANRIISWFSENYLKAHPDAPVVASTVVECYTYLPESKDADGDMKAITEYATFFGESDLVPVIGEQNIQEIADDIRKSVSGRRAKYELSYTIHIMKCQCMNFYSNRTRTHPPVS